MFFGVFLEGEFFFIYRILILSPVFSLSPSGSFAFYWKLSSLSFLGFSIFPLFFYLLHVPYVLLEVVFFVISRILKLSPVFLYLLPVPMRSPVICVLCHCPDSHSLSCFSISPSCSLAFSWKFSCFLFNRFSFFLLFLLYPCRFFEIRVLCYLTDSHSFSCFSL